MIPIRVKEFTNELLCPRCGDILTADFLINIHGARMHAKASKIDIRAIHCKNPVCRFVLPNLENARLTPGSNPAKTLYERLTFLTDCTYAGINEIDCSYVFTSDDGMHYGWYATIIIRQGSDSATGVYGSIGTYRSNGIWDSEATMPIGIADKCLEDLTNFCTELNECGVAAEMVGNYIVM